MKTNSIDSMIIVVFIAACSLLAACNDWFDVMPRTSVYEEDIYAREGGYQKVVTGLYNAMGKSTLYGREATYGLMDVVGNVWYLPQTSNSGYRYAQQYDYEHDATKSVISNIWDDAYNVIANANEMLRNAGAFQRVDSARTIDREPSIAFVSEQNRDILVGEALAVRAFVHFDLLRMFGQNPRLQPDAVSIPYVTTLKKDATPQSTAEEIVGKVKADLLQAEELLRENDPIVPGNPMPEDAWYLPAYRKAHLNYYAVCGLLARVCQYAGNAEEAGQWAEKVIDSHQFKWTTTEEVNNKDYVGMNELVFNLFVRGMNDRISTDFKAADSDYDGANVLGLSLDVFDEWFPAQDRRRKGYLYNNGKQIPQKYIVSGDETADTLNLRCRIPILRLSEMYYIACESRLEAGDVAGANDMLNAVRKARGLKVEDYTAENIRAEIDSEYRREFVGEGQLFYYIKRRNQPDLIQSQFNIDFVFPLPENEYTYANRQSNK